MQRFHALYSVAHIYATVAAKTKAAWEIISLKSSSKLHPVCPMPAGPGDCAGVLIHLKAEDLCCCFQGAWPTSRTHLHINTHCTKTIRSMRHYAQIEPHKHTGLFFSSSSFTHAQMDVCVPRVDPCSDLKGAHDVLIMKCVVRRLSVWIVYKGHRIKTVLKTCIGGRWIAEAQPNVDWIYWRGVNSNSTAIVQLHFLL